MVDFADLHDVDAVWAARYDADDGAVQCLGLPVKLMSFQRSDNVNGCSRQPHTPGDKLHGERLARAGSAEDCHVRVFVDTGIEVVEADEGVIVLVHAQQHTVGVAQLKADEWIEAGGGGRKNIAAVFLEQRRVRGAQRQGREKGCLLPEAAQLQIHILRDHELTYLPDAPFQILDAGGGDGHEDGGVVEILVVGEAVFQVVPGADGVGQVIKVRVCVAGVLDFAAVDANLLPDFLHHAFFGLSFQKQIHINAFAGVHQQRHPPGCDLRTVAVCGNHQISVVGAVHAEITTMLQVQRGWNHKGGGRYFVQRRGIVLGQIAGKHVLDALLQRHLYRCSPI